MVARRNEGRPVGLGLAVVAGVTVLGLAAWLVMQGERPTLAVDQVDAGPGPGEVAAVPESIGPDRNGSPPDVAAVRDEVEGEPEGADGPAPSDELAVFEGRAVDAAGKPMAGVLVEVHGWTGNRQRMDAYRREHGPVEFEDPEGFITGADGRFEIAFAPPPPYQFVIDLSADGLVPVGGRWGRVEPGSVKDFGDVAMVPGARVVGRLVDAEGVPVAPARRGGVVRLSINRRRRGERPREIVPEETVRTRIRADGTFAFEQAVDPGTWDVGYVQGFLLAERGTEVEIEAPASDIRIVVVRPDAMLRVAGVVVDQDGSPVRGASIDPVGVDRPNNRIVSSGRDGRFEITQRPGVVDPAVPLGIQADKEGYVDGRTASDVRWGDADVRITMRKVPALEILVVRDSDGTPVEQYGVRVLNTGGSFSSREREVVGGYEHEGGITRVTRLRRGGEKLVHVEPRPETGLAPVLTSVQFELSAPPRLTVRLPDAVVQPVRVVDADGAPLVGSSVELIDGAGEEISAQTYVRDFATGGWSTSEKGLVLDRAEADVDGRCSVRGPVGRPLVVRCRGAHVPIVESGVVLGEDERTFRASAGGTVVVRIEPPRALRGWRASADLPVEGPLDERQLRYAPSVQLHGEGGGVEGERFPAGRRSRGVPLGPEGVTLEGVPPGTWRVVCKWWVLRARGGGRSERLEAPEPLVVRVGESADVAVDASEYLAGRVRAEILVDGEAPEAGTGIVLNRSLSGTDLRGNPRRETQFQETGAEGLFEHDLFAGTWKAALALRDGTSSSCVRLAPDIVVTEGETQEMVLSATVARGRLRFLDPSGEPVGSLQLFVETGHPNLSMHAVTGTDGTVTLFGDAGTYGLSCRIRSMRNDALYRKVFRETREELGGDWQKARDALGDVMVELDPVTLVPGPAGEPVDVRLPAEWDR